MSTTTREELNSGESINELEFLGLQYQALSADRVNHNTLLWDVPSLLFVAQTVLWTLALDESKRILIRFCISIFSIVTAYASYQLFERHRLMEVVDAEQMYSIEEYIKQRHQAISDVPVMIIHHKFDKRTLISGNNSNIKDFIRNHYYYKFHNDKDSLCQQESSSIWKWIFWLMLGNSFLIFLLNLIDIVVWFVQ